MAHLRPGDPDPRPDPGRRDRAQLLLLAGLALAAVFVAFAFLLNSVIYTENLATRGESARTSHAVTVADDAARGTEAVVAYANEHNTSTYTTVEGELVSGVADLELLMGTQELADGGVLTVEHVSYRKGTWVNQSYRERNFTAGGSTTNPSFDENWTLFSGADGVRAYRIHVTDPSELENVNPLGAGNPVSNFTVEARDGSGNVWTMRVFYHDTDLIDEISGGVYVVRSTDGDGDTRFCTVPDTTSQFWVNVTEGTVAGDDCRALRFGEDIGTVTEVRYENGDQVYGTYRLMAATDEATVGGTVYNATGSAPPHPNPPVTDPAAYNSTVRVTFETESLYYETERDVEPREGNDD